MSRHSTMGERPMIVTRTTRDAQPPLRIRGRDLDQVCEPGEPGYASMLRLAMEQEKAFALRPSFDLELMQQLARV